FFVANTFTILAPENLAAARLQSTAISINRSGSGLLSRTNSGGETSSRPLRSYDIYSSFDNLSTTLSSKAKFSQKQSVSFDSYWKKSSSHQNLQDYKLLSPKRALETCHTTFYNTRCDCCENEKWFHKEFRFPSPPLENSGRHKPISLKERTDYLSLSLSPPGSRSESVFLRDYPSLSSSKDISLLDLDDIKKLRHIENRESQEDEAEYEAGGYMPINTGDVLRNQYKVCRKLGWGHFSTVWLCKNLYENGPRYVALKICKSAPMFTAVANDEIRLLQETRTNNLNHVGYSHIVQMVDTFKLISENGVHTAISLEIMGPSLLHLLMQSDLRGIQVPAVRRIIFQVLRGLTYLHQECHIIHTDIKPENILIKVDESYIRRIIDKMERFSELGVDLPRSYVSSEFWRENDSNPHQFDEDILSRFEEHRASSYPSDSFMTAKDNYRERTSQTNCPMYVSSNIEIKIADLGNACWEFFCGLRLEPAFSCNKLLEWFSIFFHIRYKDHHFSQEIQTRQYRALEVIMRAGYSYPADIWSVGCMAFELATGEMLFSPKGSTELSANIDHLCLIWETLGGIPRYITETGTESKRYFLNGYLKDVPTDNLRIWKIEDVLVEKYKWKRLDAIPFASFLESLVEPDPALRSTSSQALTNDWLLSTDL
ncbi:SRSF protein kinase 3-like, partial [Anthonomus grandis grandis]|uniref:SRSF protein kinase 3-like n=1 Tax=Anthonomus grandis grandis TaxID=2921223 RepID=UPI0021657942